MLQLSLKLEKTKTYFDLTKKKPQTSQKTNCDLTSKKKKKQKIQNGRGN